jgi:hypothetical protein
MNVHICDEKQSFYCEQHKRLPWPWGGSFATIGTQDLRATQCSFGGLRQRM